MKFGLLVFLTFVAAIPHADGAQTRGARRVEFGFDIVSGAGNFQDIQVPENEVYGTRGDGTPVGRENVNHIGIPVGLMLHGAYGWRHADLGAHVGGIHISSLLNGEAAPAASYARIDAGPAAHYRFSAFGGIPMRVGLGVDYRRTFFSNSSGGHVIEATIVKSDTLLGSYRDFVFRSSAGQSINANLSYDTESKIRGGQIDGSSVNLYVWSVEGSWGVTNQTSIDLGFDQETIDIVIPSVTSYAAIGLNVLTIEDQSRVYHMTTNVIRLGYSRRL